MSELVKRLRGQMPCRQVGVTPNGIREIEWDWTALEAERQEAADEIERLLSIVDNALMAFAETHDSDEARGRLMAAHRHEVSE